MQGIVSEAVYAQLPIKLMSSADEEREVFALVDTGFTSALTLPPSAMRELQYDLNGYAVGILADGSEFECGVYRGKIKWQDRWMNLDIHETDGTPLLGMKLMKNCRLTMDIVSDGEFTIVPLETTKE